MGSSGSSPYNINIPGGGTEGYHVLKVNAISLVFCYSFTNLNKIYNKK